MDSEDRTQPAASQAPASLPATRGQDRGFLFGQIWELEMLISGAVVFALFQLTQEVDAFFNRLAPHLSEGGLGALVFVTYYSKAILYALIACFLLNLAARAYWAGLIGLTSVFPGGVRWDRLRYGPLTLRMYRERLPALAAQIDRVDRFCSAIFSFTFVIVLLFGFSIILAGLCGVAAWILDRVLFDGERLGQVFYAVLTAVGVLLLLGPALDKLFGKRLDPEGAIARVIRRLSLINYYTQLAPLYAPVMLTLFSNIRKRLIYPVFYTVFFGLIGLVVADFVLRRGIVDIDGYTYLPPEAGAHSVTPSHYENLRLRDDFGQVPWIQADVVRGPYVKLFVPYSPLRHNEVLAERCPGVKPLQAQGLRRHAEEPAPAEAEAAVLRCLAGLHRPTLNGAPVAGLQLRFSSDARTGLRGVVAYIPTAGLPRGENVLIVQPVPRPKNSRRPPRRPYRIPFWL